LNFAGEKFSRRIVVYPERLIGKWASVVFYFSTNTSKKANVRKTHNWEHHVEGVCNWNPKLLIGYVVVCQEISLHPLNTPSKTPHPDNAMSKEYEIVIPRFPLGSSH